MSLLRLISTICNSGFQEKEKKPKVFLHPTKTPFFSYQSVTFLRPDRIWCTRDVHCSRYTRKKGFKRLTPRAPLPLPNAVRCATRHPFPRAGGSPPQPSPRSRVSLGQRSWRAGFSGCFPPVLLAGLQHHGHGSLRPTPSRVLLSNPITISSPAARRFALSFRPLTTLSRPPASILHSLLSIIFSFLIFRRFAHFFRPITPLSRRFFPFLCCPFRFCLTNHRFPFCGLLATPSPSLSSFLLSPQLSPFSMPYVPGPSV